MTGYLSKRGGGGFRQSPLIDAQPRRLAIGHEARDALRSRPPDARPVWAEGSESRRPMNFFVPLCLRGEKFFHFQQHEPNRLASPSRIQESLTSACKNFTTETVESRRGAVSREQPVSPPRSSNRTCGFPASGFPTGFTTAHDRTPCRRRWRSLGIPRSPNTASLLNGPMLRAGILRRRMRKLRTRSYRWDSIARSVT
jgi:hypothetical protein